DTPLLELAQVAFERPRQLGQMTGWQASAIVRGLLPYHGYGLVLRQRLLRGPNALQQGLQLGDQRIRLVDAVELLRHWYGSGRGDGRHGAQPGNHPRQPVQDEIDLAFRVAFADRQPQAAKRPLPRIAEGEDHVTRFE